MLARCMLSVCVCVHPFVCLSVTSRYCIETTGRISLVLTWRLPSTYQATQKNIFKLQKAQNLLARVVTCSPQSCSPRTLLQQLHWLPVKHRIDFKIANITFRTLHCSQPAYLRLSLHACHSTRSLRLSNTNLLSAPFVRTSFGSRSFSVTAPKIWNSLPLSLVPCFGSSQQVELKCVTYCCSLSFCVSWCLL